MKFPVTPPADIVLEPSAQSAARMIQEAINTCAAQGGGRVVLKAGEYRSGTVILKSGVTLHLEKNAVLLGSSQIGDYFVKEGMPTALLFAEGAENIAITGEGTVDGNARVTRRRKGVIPDWVESKKTFGTWIPAFEYEQPSRPISLVHFADCRNVVMDGIHLVDSPRWTLHLLGCSDVVLRTLTIRTPPMASNGDGIDLDGCRDVLVEDCDIETGDDAICLKNSRTWGFARPCRNITIRRCRAFSGTHGFCIGHETQDDFENITVSDLDIGPANGHRTLTGIGLGSIDGGSLRHIRISDIRMTEVVAPFQIRLSNEGKVFRGHTPGAAYHEKIMGRRPPGEIRDIVLENITVRGATGNSFVSGLSGHPLQDLCFRNIRVEFVGEIDSSDVNHEVPELVAEYPHNEMWRLLPAYGFFFRHIEGLELSVIEITATREKRPAIWLKDVISFDCRNVDNIESNEPTVQIG